MKRLLLVFALVTAVGFVACKKDTVKKILTFYMEDQRSFDVKAQMLPTSMLNQVLPLAGYEITTESEAEFKRNNTTASLVKDVSLDKVRLTILDPPNKSFRFLKSIAVKMSLPGEDPQTVAMLNDIPDNIGNVIELNPTGVKLDKYIKAERYFVSTEVVLDEPVNDDVKLESYIRFKVTADPL